VHDYRTGKQDWMGAGLPTEGTNAQQPRLADVMRRDVPTCSLGERDRDLASSPVTAADGKLVGLVRKKDVGAR
jgi:hypothetical protein